MAAPANSKSFPAIINLAAGGIQKSLGKFVRCHRNTRDSQTKKARAPRLLVSGHYFYGC